MIIDFHTHIVSPRIKNNRQDYLDRDPLFNQLYSNPKAKLATAEDLIACMDEQAIDRSVTQNMSWSQADICHETNDYILECIARFPDRLIGFGMVKLDSPETALPEIERCAKNGMKGIGEIRLEPGFLSNPAILKPVMQKIQEYNLILLTHTSEPVGHLYPGKGDMTPERLYPLITAFPELKLVCAHWGGGLPFYALMPEVKKSLENVYFDSAASPFLYRPQIYSEVSQLVGEGKILFGTDYPLLTPKRLLSEINGLGLSDPVKELILAENAQRLLGI